MSEIIFDKVDAAIEALLDARLELKTLHAYVKQLEESNEDLSYQILELEDDHGDHV